MALVKRSTASPAAPSPPDQGNLDVLEVDLGSADISIRRKAARALTELPAAIPLLCAHLTADPALSVRSIIFAGLIKHRTIDVVKGLIPLLRSEDPHLRNSAIEALQDMPEEVAPHVEALLADKDSDVRIFVVNILSALRHPSVPAWLKHVIETDPHINVCAAAVDALAEIGEPEQVASIEALPKRFPGVPFIAFSTAACVRRIRGR